TFQFSAKTLTKAGRDTSARALRKLSARGVPPRQGVEDRDLPATDFEQVGCLEVAPDLLTKVGENRLYVVGDLCVDRVARPAAVIAGSKMDKMGVRTKSWTKKEDVRVLS